MYKIRIDVIIILELLLSNNIFTVVSFLVLIDYFWLMMPEDLVLNPLIDNATGVVFKILLNLSGIKIFGLIEGSLQYIVD